MKNKITLILIFIIFCIANKNACRVDEKGHEVEKDTVHTTHAIESIAPNEYRAFSSYDEALFFYHRYFKFKHIYPNSSAIHCLEYFHTSKRKTFVIYFTSNPGKGYIFEGMSNELWYYFINSQSKGSFYNNYIKGQYTFNL